MTGTRGRPSTNEMTPFGRWLEAALVRSNISRSDLAERTGVTTRRISSWFYGVTPRPEALAAIADAVGVPIDEVYRAATNRGERAPGTLARELATLAAGTPEELLVPLVVALRALQEPAIREAALEDLERARGTVIEP